MPGTLLEIERCLLLQQFARAISYPQVQALHGIQLITRRQHHRSAASSTQLYAWLQAHAGVVLQPDAAVQAQHLGAADQQHIQQQWQAGATLQGNNSREQQSAQFAPGTHTHIVHSAKTKIAVAAGNTTGLGFIGKLSIVCRKAVLLSTHQGVAHFIAILAHNINCTQQAGRPEQVNISSLAADWSPC
jgi:hypothetical protein